MASAYGSDGVNRRQHSQQAPSPMNGMRSDVASPLRDQIDVILAAGDETQDGDDDAQNEDFVDWDRALPMSRDEQLAERESIKEAMKSTVDVVDALQHNGLDAQAVRMVKDDVFPEYAFDTIARDILLYAHRSHNHPLLFSYTNPDRNNFSSVEERLASIKHSLKKSKAMVKQLMDPVFLHRLCDAPKKELDKKNSNKKLNAKRNLQVRAGKDVLAAQSAGDGEEQQAANMLDIQTSVKGKPLVLKTSKAAKATSTRKRTSKRNTTAAKATSSKHTRDDDETEDETKAPAKRGKVASEAHPALWRTHSMAVSSGGGTSSLNRFRATTSMHMDAAKSGFLHTHSTVATHEHPGQPARSFFSYQYTQLSVVELEALAEGNPPPAGVREELSARYRQTICRLLSVQWQHAANSTLTQLRTYARAYNATLHAAPWYCLEIPQRYGYVVGPWLCDSSGDYVHFAPVMDDPYTRIAIEREDILANGQQSPQDPFWFTPTTAEEHRALGSIQNPLGTPAGLYSGVDPRRAH